MIDVIICLLLLIGIGACVAEVYFVLAYVKSGFGEYPPFFPSFGKMKKVCLNEAKEILRAAEKPLKVIDLGCGSGSLIIPLAKEFPNHEFYGYDWDVVPYSIASFWARRIPNVQLFCEDFTKVDLREADLVLVFGGAKLFANWGDVFVKQLRQGAIVLAEVFEVKQLTPSKVLEAKSYGMDLKVYRYEIDKKTLAKN